MSACLGAGAARAVAAGPAPLLAPLLVPLLGLLLAGCAGTGGTRAGETAQAAAEVAEARYLDAGILEFETGIKEAEVEEGEVFREVRKAEALYFPWQLRQAMERTEAWRNVWIVPAEAVTDLRVEGTILASDGAELVLEIAAADAAGRNWLRKKYRGKAAASDYTPANTRRPFEDLFDEIARDLLRARDAQSAAALKEARYAAELRFARSFSEDAFAGYLEEKRGRYRVTGLPAENDPIYQRVLQIKERDDLFLDTLQGYYDHFAGGIETSYTDWARQSEVEVAARSKQRSKTLLQGVLSALAIAGGIALDSKNDTARTVLIGAGAYGAVKTVESYQQSKIHDEALRELGESLELELQPQVVEVEDRIVTLQGSVTEQYDQWHGILKEIYFVERGAPGGPAAAAESVRQ